MRGVHNVLVSEFWITAYNTSHDVRAAQVSEFGYGLYLGSRRQSHGQRLSLFRCGKNLLRGFPAALKHTGCCLHAQKHSAPQFRKIVIRLSLCIEPPHIRKRQVAYSLLEGINLFDGRAVEHHCSYGAVCRSICCLHRSRTVVRPHRGFELRRSPRHKGHDLSFCVEARVVVVALLGCRHPKRHVNHRRFHGDFGATWIHQAYEIPPEDQDLLFSSSPEAQSCTPSIRLYRTQRHALKVASIVARWLEAHGFEFRSYELCGNFMSTCPCPAALKQVVREEPHIRANRFRPNSGRGLISSIVTGKSYARSREQGDDNQGAHPTGNEVLCVRLLHDGTVLREVSSRRRWQG